MEQVLVTGGAGFIGSHLVERLVKEGFGVRVLDNLFTGKRENLAHIEGPVEFIEGDIRDADVVNRSVDGVRFIWHQAAMASVPRSIAEPVETHQVNVNGTLNVLEAARKSGVKRVVMASSSSVYGETPTLPKEETMAPDPICPYAVHKLINELYAKQYFMHYGLETVCLRYFNVFGPRQDPRGPYAAVLPCFVRQIRNGTPPHINGDGTQSRDFTYVTNVVEANWCAIQAPAAPGNVYNIATHHRVTILELAEQVSALMGWNGGIEFGPPRPGDIEHSYASIARAQTDLGYQPPVGFVEGLQITVPWYQQLAEI